MESVVIVNAVVDTKRAKLLLARMTGHPLFWHAYSGALESAISIGVFLASQHAEIIHEAACLGVRAIRIRAPKALIANHFSIARRSLQVVGAAIPGSVNHRTFAVVIPACLAEFRGRDADLLVSELDKHAQCRAGCLICDCGQGGYDRYLGSMLKSFRRPDDSLGSCSGVFAFRADCLRAVSAGWQKQAALRSVMVDTYTGEIDGFAAYLNFVRQYYRRRGIKSVKQRRTRQR